MFSGSLLTLEQVDGMPGVVVRDAVGCVMTARRPCPAAPGPLEGYAARFDDLFGSLAQRRGFREYLAGLLAPRERNKTMTALAGAEPVTGAGHPAVQRLQFFLSESRWDADQVNSRRLELLLADPATAPHGGGVLVIDDSGDRKDGVKTAHVGHQWLGRYGKTDNGVVTVTTVCADSAYGDQDGFRGELAEAGLPFVMALKPRRGTWAYGPDAHTPVDAAGELAWHGPEDPGDWHPVTRAFRDGHTETWYAADATLGWWGPDGARRLVVATADPGALPAKATWYLVTNLPRPGGPRAVAGIHPPADLAEIVRIYGIRHWIEQGYKQVKDQLGWADFQVRSDTAIRRHQALVNCAFSFCWDAWFHDHPAPHQQTAQLRPTPGRGERGAARRLAATGAVLAAGAARDTRLAHPLDRAAALVAGMVQSAPATAAASPNELGHRRPQPAPLS